MAWLRQGRELGIGVIVIDQWRRFLIAIGQGLPAPVAEAGVQGSAGRPCHCSGKITLESGSGSAGSLNMGFTGKEHGT